MSNPTATDSPSSDDTSPYNITNDSTQSIIHQPPDTDILQHEEAVLRWKQIFPQKPTNDNDDEIPSDYAYPIENDPWGDRLSSKDPDHIRILFQNIYGLQYDKFGGKLNTVCATVRTTDIDIIGLSEHNTDTAQYYVRQTFRDTIQKHFESSRMYFSTSPIKFKSTFKPGGTAIIAQGSITGKIMNHHNDHLGRWTHITLQGKRSQHITVIVCYQCVPKDVRYAGPKTVFSQQHSILGQTHHHINACPRKHFKDDLSKLLDNLTQSGNSIILAGDFNQTLDDYHGQLQDLASQYNLHDVMSRRHTGDLPPTHARGRKCIDILLASESIAPSIRKCGYLSFGELFQSDHRGLFVDLDATTLLGNKIETMPPSERRDIKSHRPKEVSKYCTAVHEYLTSHRVYERMKTLLQQQTFNPAHLESIDRDLTRASLHAGNLCKTHFKPGEWHTGVAAAREQVNILQRVLSAHRNNLNMSDTIAKLQQKLRYSQTFVIPDTYEECNKLLQTTRASIRRMIKEDTDLRKAELNQKAAILAGLDSADKQAKILRRLIRAEETSKVYKYLQVLRGESTKSSGLQSLLIPNDETPPEKCTDWTQISDPMQIAQQMLNYNKIHFKQADGTPWTRAPLCHAVNFDTNTVESAAILSGTYDTTTLDQISSKVIQRMEQILQPPANSNTISVSDFTGKMKVWKETTSTSPSGIHLGHYKALLAKNHHPEDSDESNAIQDCQQQIIQLRCNILNLCIAHHYCLNRWKTVASVLLEKDPGIPKIHRIRIIHLYEADYNFILSQKWRDLILNANKQQALNPNQHAVPGSDALSPVLMEELQYEYCRITRSTMVRFDKDARACYDRIIPSMGGLSSRRLGLHPDVAALNGQMLEQAEYHLKTRSNITEEYYSHDPPNNPVYGSGQGAGNSPGLWNSISSLLFDCHQETSNGATFTDPTKENSLHISMTGYVDDCTSSTMLSQSATTPEVISAAEDDAEQWNSYLTHSGGRFNAGKCSYHVISYIFSELGHPVQQDAKFSPSIKVRDHETNETITIKQLRPGEAHKTLGCYKSPNGRQAKQFLQSKSKSDRYSRILNASGLSRKDAMIFYQSIYLPSVGYPLPVCHFTKQELHTVQAKAVRSFFSKCGYNRNSPLSVLFTPFHLGGAGFKHLYDIQGTGQILLFLSHWRFATSQLGKLLRIVTKWVQYYLGTSQFFLDDVTTPLPHIPTKWYTSLRNYLSDSDTQLKLATPISYPFQREEDKQLMDVFITSGTFTPGEIVKLNYCRLYLNVHTVADITLADGLTLDATMQKGTVSLLSSRSKHSPIKQSRPPERVWMLWRKACRLFSTKGILKERLGKWHFPPDKLSREWFAYFDHYESILYVRAQGPTQTNSNIYNAYYSDSINHYTTPFDVTTDLGHSSPIDVHPTEDGWKILQYPSKILLTQSFLPSTSSFEEYLLSQTKWEHYLLSQTQFLIPHEQFFYYLSFPTLFAATDGSYLEWDNTGSYAWILSTSTGIRLAQCTGHVTAHRGSSYRSEAYGLLSFYVFLEKAQAYYGCSINVSKVYSDSKSAIDVLADWNCWKPRSTLSPEWDVFIQLATVRSTLGQYPPVQHIKSHQDDHATYHSLPLPAQLNVDADRLTSTVSPISGSIPPPIFPSSHIQLLHTSGAITARPRSTLYSLQTIQKFHQSLSKRWNWSPHTLDTIDWHTFRRSRAACRRKAIINPITHTKLINGMLPLAPRQHRNNPARPSTCPCCHEQIETDRHLYSCLHPSKKAWRSDLQSAMVQKFANDPYTDPHISTLMIEGLMSALREEPPTIHIPEDYYTWWRQQSDIGWLGLFSGFLTSEWRRLQQQHLQRTPDQASITGKKRPSVQRWLAQMTLFFQTQWSLLWKLRNQAQHGNDENPLEKKARAREQLLREIEEISRLSPHLPPTYQAAITIQQQAIARNSTTKLTNSSMQDWISVFGPLYKKVAATTIRASRQGLQLITKFFSPTTPDNNPDKYPP